jgi:hypothetical protein
MIFVNFFYKGKNVFLSQNTAIHTHRNDHACAFKDSHQHFCQRVQEIAKIGTLTPEYFPLKLARAVPPEVCCRGPAFRNPPG